MSIPRKKAPRTKKASRSKGRPSSLGQQEANTRAGIGNDIHRLVAGRKLILGGVRIPADRGPRAHSDGDALAHAVADALLGAAGLGDIGLLFPDTLPRWRNASSLHFLMEIRRLLARSGYAVINIDSTVGLEQPKLQPHIQAMRRCLSRALGIAPHQITVKAKSGEGMDSVGRSEAVRADAVALIRKIG